MHTTRDIATMLTVTIAAVALAALLMMNIVDGYLPPVL